MPNRRQIAPALIRAADENDIAPFEIGKSSLQRPKGPRKRLRAASTMIDRMSDPPLGVNSSDGGNRIWQAIFARFCKVHEAGVNKLSEFRAR